MLPGLLLCRHLLRRQYSCLKPPAHIRSAAEGVGQPHLPATERTADLRSQVQASGQLGSFEQPLEYHFGHLGAGFSEELVHSSAHAVGSRFTHRHFQEKVARFQYEKLSARIERENDD